MKTGMRLTLVVVLVFSVMSFPVSCSKNRVQSEQVQAPRPELSAPEKPEAGNDPPRVEATAPEATAPEGAEVEFANGNIYFEFDSAALSPQAQRVLTDKAVYLRTHPVIRITIEGHCDERGTEEYNMALGDMRAKSAKTFLMDLGIGADRLDTISYGEERPVAHSRDEVSWAQNRRAQFVIQ